MSRFLSFSFDDEGDRCRCDFLISPFPFIEATFRPLLLCHFLDPIPSFVDTHFRSQNGLLPSFLPSSPRELSVNTLLCTKGICAEQRTTASNGLDVCTALCPLTMFNIWYAKFVGLPRSYDLCFECCSYHQSRGSKYCH